MLLRKLLRSVLLAALFVFAAPTVAEPTSSPPPLDAYGDLPGVEDMALSPSGKGLAIVGKIDGVRQLVVLDGDHKPRMLIPIGEAKLRYIEWAGEEIVVIVTSSTQDLGPGFTTAKHEFYVAIVVPLDGRKPEAIYTRSPSIVKAVFGDFGTRLIDGKWTSYFGGIELVRSADRMEWVFSHGRPALYKIDLATNSPRKLSRSAEEGHWLDWLIDGSGNAAAILDVASANGKWEIVNEQRKTIATGYDPNGDVDLISFGKDGTSVIYSLQDDTKGIIRWLEVPLAGGTPAEILTDVDIERPYIDPTNGRLLGYLNRGMPARPVLFDPMKQAIVTKVYRAFPKLDVDVVQWTPDMKFFLVRTRGNGDSGTWYVVDVTNRKADPVGYERARINPAQVGPISTIHYKAADGTELQGILTLPPGREAKNLPVIAFPHGGPHARDEETFDWWAQAFASRGYAVFQPNFRGSTNRDLAFIQAGNGQWGRKMQTDISDGIADLVRQGIVDPKRGCIVGASYGGYAALAGVTLQSGLYRCSVAVAPVSDLSDMFWTDYRESGENKMAKRSLKEDLGDPSTFAAVSPRKHAARADAPILLIHGKDDTVVAFKQSTAMADALKDAGKPYEFVTLREEDHWLSRPETRKQMLEATMRFVQQHNPPD